MNQFSNKRGLLRSPLKSSVPFRWYNNALAETINGLYKAQVIHKGGPWRGLGEVERATLTLFQDQRLAWFNHRRLRPIGDVPPAEFEMTMM